MRRFVLFLVGFLTAICGIAVGAMLRGRFPANQSDWVAFSGALIGAAVTVFGAILVFEWQQDRDDERQWRMIDDQLESIMASVRRVQECPKSDPVRRLIILRTSVAALKTDWQVLKDSRHWVKPRSAPMIRALAEIGRMKVDVPEYESLLNQASEQEAAGEPNDELVERLQSEMTTVEWGVVCVRGAYDRSAVSKMLRR